MAVPCWLKMLFSKKILSLVNRQNIVLLNSINMVATKKLSRQNATYLF